VNDSMGRGTETGKPCRGSCGTGICRQNPRWELVLQRGIPRSAGLFSAPSCGLRYQPDSSPKDEIKSRGLGSGCNSTKRRNRSGWLASPGRRKENSWRLAASPTLSGRFFFFLNAHHRIRVCHLWVGDHRLLWFFAHSSAAARADDQKKSIVCPTSSAIVDLNHGP